MMTKDEFADELAKLKTKRQQEGRAAHRYDTGPMTSYESDRARLSHQQGERAAAWMESQDPKPMRFDKESLIESLPHAFMLRAGLPVHRVHPMAEWASGLSLQRLAEQLSIRSLSSGELGSVMSHGFSKVITAAYDSADNVAPLVSDVVVPNFHPAEFPKVDTVDLLEVSKSGNPDGANVPLQILNLAGAETGAVNSYRSRILVSRALILSDSFSLIATLLQQLSAQAGRLPMQLIGRIISDNANLADGQPLLGSGNTAAAGVNLTGLGSASSLMRLNRSDADNVLNLSPAVLLVRPETEMTWRSVLKSVELPSQPNIRLIVNPWLPSASTYSYLLADPSESATFVRMVFAKPLKPTVTSGPLPPEFDGTYLDFSLDFGIKAVSRAGIVRIPS